MPRSTARGRHAAPHRSWAPVAGPRSAGRHAAPGTSYGQPVAVVLLGVTATSLGLVSLLPSQGAAVPAASVGTASVQSPSAPATVAERSALAERRVAAARVSRARAVRPPAAPRPKPVDPLPGCRAQASATDRYANGRIPLSALCTLPGHAGHALRADAARAFARLDVAYRARFGERLCLTDSYRSLSSQYALARRKPGLAARPGTSEHGYGVAVDLACGVDSYRTPQHRWLVANAGRFGWEQPRWAQDGGRREEPWHWELREQ